MHPLDEQGRRVLARERAEGLRSPRFEGDPVRARVGRALIAVGARLAHEEPQLRARAI